MSERRRCDRYKVELQVDLVERKGDRRGVAIDVGRHGIFLRMDDPPDERLLVQLKIHLSGGPIQALGMVARRVLPGSGATGAGVQFFVLAPDARDRWDGYVATLRGSRLAGRASTRWWGSRPAVPATESLSENPIFRQARSAEPEGRSQQDQGLLREARVGGTGPAHAGPVFPTGLEPQLALVPFPEIDVELDDIVEAYDGYSAAPVEDQTCS